MLAERNGPIYGVIPAYVDTRPIAGAKINRLLGLHDLPASVSCHLGGLLAAWRVDARVIKFTDDSKCRLAVEDVRDIAAENEAVATALGHAIGRYGLALDVNSCHVRQAYLGSGLRPYQLCRATLLD
jgi:hypothetical protein